MNDVDQLPWWKYGYLWLVIAGPAAVIVASMVTIWLAVTLPDPVLTGDQYRRGTAAMATPVGGDGAAGSAALTPAVQARNHAATPAGGR